MAIETAYYFIRANGGTFHANPKNSKCYVQGEPDVGPKGYINHVPYCLAQGIARIGWPDTGDMSRDSKIGALKSCYDLASLKPYIQRYLNQFRDIEIGSVVIMPDKDKSDRLYMGDVTGGYHYFHRLPQHTYENAHRVAVRWDRRGGAFAQYSASTIGLNIHGGFFRLAFHRIDVTQTHKLIDGINAAGRELENDG